MSADVLQLQQKLNQLELERERLQQQVSTLNQSVESLSQELSETNHGVVALYAELDDRAMQLREATDLKSRFLSYMSHEFRTPLSSIRSISDILLARMDGPLTEEQEKQVRFVQGAALELTEMVNDLLDLAKVEAGRVSISPGWFEMVDLFSALRGMFKPMLSSTSVVLHLIEPEGRHRIYTDDRKLSQILRNFISNALKFTHAGEVRVTAHFGDDDMVTFAVADTGIGIAEHNLGSIFQDWVQLESPAQKRLRGSGLGLSLSKRLAELLGGSVAVRSQLGVGSVFSVTIPCRLPGHETASSEKDAR